MDRQPFLTASLPSLRWDKVWLHQSTVESSTKATCRLWTPSIFWNITCTGLLAQLSLFRSWSKKWRSQQRSSAPDPSLPALSASLTVDLALHKLPYPNNHWRPTPITAQQETVPPMGSKRIPMPCRNGVYISNIRWEYSKAIMTCQLRLTSALNIRTQIVLQVHQESIRAMLDVWWSTLHCSYFLPRSAGKQKRSLGISEFSWNMLPDYL